MSNKVLFVIFGFLSLMARAQKATIIPQPVSMVMGNGQFVVDRNTTLKYDAADRNLKAAADFFSSCINNLSGIALVQNGRQQKRIELKIVRTPGIGDEGYLLDVKPASVTITANSKTGIVYGFQTLFQLLPAVRTNAPLQIPVMQVKDFPRFGWRGMMLDVSRHFFSADFVKEFIDLMALYKFNTFHWHLTDDQGWRIEIKKYPKLTQVGAWRVDETDKVWKQRPQAREGAKPTYGGYYTQEQIKEIVRYAAVRNITIVPEIELPGHSAAAIAAYPFLSCTQQPQLPMTGGNFTNISSNYCAGNDSAFLFLQDVLQETMNLFPSRYIHIGGDEVDKTSWKHCPKCQARIKKEGLKNEEELQSYFIKRMETFLISKHRRMIGWDEILEGGLAPEATVMSWRGESGGIEAARMNHEVVMTPANPVYFDYYQGDPASEPLAFGGFNTLKRVYSYEPVPKELPAEKAHSILGAQGNVWAEYISTPAYATYMVLPRMLALAEVLWSPKEAKDWNAFNERLQPHFNAFDQKGLPYSKGNFKVDIAPVVQNQKIVATLSTEIYNGEVYFTTDGTVPTPRSNRYTTPLSIDSSVVLKAITVVNGENKSPLVAEQAFVLHKAIGASVTYRNPVNGSYRANGPNTLTDGIRGTAIFQNYWHGFAEKDLVATVQLDAEKTIHSIALGCLQSYKDWVMMPKWVKFECSDDGQNFTELKTVYNTLSENEQAVTIRDFRADFPERKTRFIRVTAKVLDALPKGHSGEGRPAWLFADEIVVE